MTLHIHNPEADKLARELAARMGKPVEEALLDILREKVESGEGMPAPRKDFSVEDVMKIAKRCAALPDFDTRSADEIIGYDERGLPS